MGRKLKPGMKAPRSGCYEIVGPSGTRTGIERTMMSGKPLPPTNAPGARYVLQHSQPSADQAFEARRARGAEMTDAEIEALFDRLGTEPPRPDDLLPDTD